MALDKFDHDKNFVCETLGWENKKYTALCKSMSDFFEHLSQADNKRMSIKSILLEEYLKSDEFKLTGVTLETDTDYFLLGFSFANVLNKDKDDIPDFIKGALLSAVMTHGHGSSQSDDEEKVVN